MPSARPPAPHGLVWRSVRGLRNPSTVTYMGAKVGVRKMFALTADQLAVRDMAKSFAMPHRPNALQWDETEHFRSMSFVRRRRSGWLRSMSARAWRQQHQPPRCRADLRGLSTGCPCVASFLSIHNMVAWVVDGFVAGSQRPLSAAPRHDGAYRQLLPHRAGRGSDAAALTTRARAGRWDYVLDGVKQSISGAGEATSISSWRAPAKGGRAGFPPFSSRRTRRA